MALIYESKNKSNYIIKKRSIRCLLINGLHCVLAHGYHILKDGYKRVLVIDHLL